MFSFSSKPYKTFKDEEILNDHTEKIERLIGSLAGLEGRLIPETVQKFKTEAQVAQRNNDLDF